MLIKPIACLSPRLWMFAAGCLSSRWSAGSGVRLAQEQQRGAGFGRLLRARPLRWGGDTKSMEKMVLENLPLTGAGDGSSGCFSAGTCQRLVKMLPFV